MPIERDLLYRLPWSQSDNCGGWVEVTDSCDFDCPGCYRHKLEGHRPVEEVKKDIVECRKLTNCDGMAVAGGEPLLYPDIVDVIEFIHKNKMKPTLLTNGSHLNLQMARDLKKAGMFKILFHVDSSQMRENWAGKSEFELNELRQYYADMMWEIGGVQCGFHLTISRSNIQSIPEIMDWSRKNIQKVQHLSLIARRGLPIIEGLHYRVNGEVIDISNLTVSYRDLEENSISSNDMYEMVSKSFPNSKPCAYLSGTSFPETYKFLIIVYVGSKNNIFGVLGAKTIEMVQVFHHLFKGRYSSGSRKTKVGRKIFMLSLFDRNLREALARFLKSAMKNPLTVVDPIYTQVVNFQQPIEIIEGERNLCDGCLNMMIHEGKLINSCRLDEYRIFGGLVTPIVDKRRSQ